MTGNWDLTDLLTRARLSELCLKDAPRTYPKGCLCIRAFGHPGVCVFALGDTLMLDKRLSVGESCAGPDKVFSAHGTADDPLCYRRKGHAGDCAVTRRYTLRLHLPKPGRRSA